MPTLDTLLKLIRAQGISVGAAEYRRLQQILQTQHQLTSNEFRDLLGTVLAKNEEQRERITHTYEHFTRQSMDYDSASGKASASNKATQPANANTEVAEVSKPSKQKEYMPWIAGVLGIITLALLLAYFHDKKEAEVPNQTVSVKEKTTGKPQAVPAAKLNAANKEKSLITDLPIWSIESITITARPVIQEFIPPFLLFLGSTGGFLWLLSRALQRTRQRKPEPIVYQRVLGYHTPEIKHANYKLFNTHDRQTLSWGVGHYFDDQQQRIDVERSVAASANEGFPVLAFEKNRYEREVWLWQDRLNHSPLQVRMIREIRQVLTQANIHVKHGFFNGMPGQITDRQQRLKYQVMGALPQPVPLVLLCLDANNVNTAFSQSKHTTAQIFQHLKQWSTLAVVDCNPAVASLKSTLNDYQLPYLLPSQVADWFSRQSTGEMRRKACVLSDVYRWACACALAQRIITEDEAYALHTALGLNCAWQYGHLRAYGSAAAKGLDFSKTQTERINDLNDDDRKLAIHFWRARFKAIDLEHANGSGYPDWGNSYSRYQAVKIPVALLGLWDDSPAEAINTLNNYYQHHRGDLQRPIKQHLAHYSCEGMTGAHQNNNDTPPDYIQLPFTWESLTASDKQQLLAMGFAGHTKQLSLQMDKVSSVLMGGLAGLVCYGLYQSAVVLMDKPPQLQTRLNSAAPLKIVEYNKAGTIFLGTAKHHLQDVSALIKEQYPQNDALENKLIEVNWRRDISPAQETISSGSNTGETAQLWRLGTRRYPPPRQKNSLGQDIVASHAFIKATPDNATAQALAIQLLDSGSADQVLIANKLTSFQKRFRNWVRLPDDAGAKQQVQRLTMGEDLTDRQANLRGMPNTLVYEGELATLLAKLSNKKYGQQTKDQMEKLGFEVKESPVLQNPLPMGEPIMLGNGIKLMPIPAGSFEMGSNDGDDDEKPVHTVTISQPFWMGESEVTFDQYEAYITATGKDAPSDSGWGKADRPVINVSWQEAVDYTQWLTENNSTGASCRLPSEAEWEYAARAGSTTKFYWGDEASRDYANYSGAEGRDKWGRETAPVKQFKPNGFGLYDMSGNVWEWTQDRWHDDYKSAPVEGSAWETGGSASRVLRGGSWGLTSNNVRSAARAYSVDGLNFLGFRVVCSPIER